MRRLVGLLLSMVLMASLLSQSLAAVDDPPTKTDLTTLQAQEQAVLAELFALNRERDSTQKRLKEITEEQATTGALITELQVKITQTEGALTALKSRLAHRLQLLQEGGQLNPFSILLGADSLGTFLDRLESLQLLLAHDRRLMTQVKETNSALGQQSQALQSTELRLGALADEARGAEAKLSAEIVKHESILAGLQAERGRMETELAKLEQAWAEVPGVLASLSDSINRSAEQATGFEPDQVKLSLFPPGATAVVSDTTLNKLVTNGIGFQFKKDAALLQGRLAKAELLLQGGFSIVNGTAIRFTPLEMRLNGVPVPAGVVTEAVGKRPIQLELGRWISPFRLQDLKLAPGALTVQSGL